MTKREATPRRQAEPILAIGPGDQLSHYRIDALVAEGRASRTFRGSDLQTGNPVAIEIPDPEIEMDPVFLERLQREDEIGKNLHHPGLIRLIEKHAGPPGEGRSYVVREWFEGTPLRELVSRGDLSIDRAIRITISICEVAEYVHTHGILYLDIEPEHVLVGSDDQVKLLHLGLTSKFGARRLTFTKLAQVVGLSQYVSPEELKGKRSGPSSDVYSIGVMLYEMVTRRLPFDSGSIEDRWFSYPVPPREIDSAISPQLQEVIYRALERNPANRYANAHDFRRDLEHLDTVGVADRVELREWKKRRASRSKRLLLYVAMALVPIVILGLLLYFAKH